MFETLCKHYNDQCNACIATLCQDDVNITMVFTLPYGRNYFFPGLKPNCFLGICCLSQLQEPGTVARVLPRVERDRNQLARHGARRPPYRVRSCSKLMQEAPQKWHRPQPTASGAGSPTCSR